MQHSSRVSACRRGQNTHNAAKPRAPGQSRLRARDGPQRTAQASGAGHQGLPLFGCLPPVLHCARRCLTPRSSRAPTACHTGPAGGTRYIFATRARASHRWCRLNSNVRRRNPPSWQSSVDNTYHSLIIGA